MSRLKNPFGSRMAFLFVLALVVAGPSFADDCEVPDPGPGNPVVLPPAGCGYLSPTQFHMIVQGFPPGTSIQIEPTHFQIICGKCPFAGGICEGQSGGTFPGGEIEKICTKGRLRMKGLGTLAGYERVVDVSLEMETHTDVRPPGSPSTFDTRMHILQGQLPPGDPDFDLLDIKVGAGLGLPVSPGQTTLTDNGDTVTVDSSFDINYELSFIGAAGGPFAGASGTTAGMVTMEAQDVGLEKGEQKCVNSLNKAGGSVVKAQLGAAGSCIKEDAQTVPGPVDVNTCKNDDTNGKVAGAAQKAVDADTARCTPAPEFGRTSGANVGTVGQAQAAAYLDDLYGTTVNLATDGQADCLLSVNKASTKALLAHVKEFNSCKKAQLKADEIPTASDLDLCLGVDAKDKIAKSLTKLGAAIQGSCQVADYATVFPGDCAASGTAAALQDCMEDRMRCRTCLGVSQMDGFTPNCDLFDNGALDTSCS
jgi:hypothetical protein